MQQLEQGFQALKLSYIPSQANFITLKSPFAGIKLYEKLLKRGIIVRPLDPYGLKEHVRITIGTPEQNQHLLNVLKGEIND